MPTALNVTGERYGLLTAVRRAGTRAYPSGQKRTLWLFRCDCGAEITKSLFDVRRADIKSCGCGRKGRPAHNRLPEGEAAFRTLFLAYETRAKVLGVEFQISPETFRALTKARCHYCNAVPSQDKSAASGKTNGRYRYNGLDRINNAGGYVLGNVATCCGTCNRAKHAMGRIEFLDWVRRVYRWSCED